MITTPDPSMIQADEICGYGQGNFLRSILTANASGGGESVSKTMFSFAGAVSR
jgi:hypothetical protein